MATDYISRDIAISELMPIYKSASFRNRNVFATARKCLEVIENAPVADAVERKRGKWEEVSVTNTDDDEIQKIECVVSAKCSNCRKYYNGVFFYGIPMEEAKYCPHCGADMREANNG